MGRRDARQISALVAAWVAAGLALLLPPARGDTQDGAPVAIVLNYEVYRAGFHILDTALAIDLGSTRFEVVGRFETRGLFGLFSPWQSTSSTEGVVTADGFVPRHHRQEGELRGAPRRVTVEYGDGAALVRELVPSAADEDRDEVPDLLRHSTVDVVSAVLTLIRAMDDGRTCNGRMPVFDGRRRFDLIVVDRGRKPFAASQVSREHTGEATLCEFTIQPIAGYQRPREDEGDSARWRRPRQGRAWLSPIIDGVPSMPLRIELDSAWGDTIVTLKEYGRRAGIREQDRPAVATVGTQN